MMPKQRRTRKQETSDVEVVINRTNPDPTPEIEVSEQERDEFLSEIKLISRLAQEMLNVKPTLALATQLDNNNKLKVLKAIEELLVPIYVYWAPKGQPFRYKVNEVILIRCDKDGWNIEHKNNQGKPDDKFDYSQHAYIIHQITVLEMWEQLVRWYRFMSEKVNLKERITAEHQELMQKVQELTHSNNTTEIIFEKLNKLV